MKLDEEIKDVLDQLRQIHIIHNGITNIKELSGTTDGRVFNLIDNNSMSYILKFDRIEQVQLIKTFYQSYEDITLFPKILLTDHDKSFILYSYIKGTTHINRGLKKDWLATLVCKLLNHYEIFQNFDIWGRIDYPCGSWFEFNEISIREAKANIQDTLSMEDYHIVESLVYKLFEGESNINRYLLHGDTGIHNFVFDQYSLKGVIDPSPMVGPLIYDFIYAFCSSPDDINTDTLFSSYYLLDHKPVTDSRLIEEVAIQLYCRIGICLRHHREDLPDYLRAWKYWKVLL
jgi:hypothetical protein